MWQTYSNMPALAEPNTPAPAAPSMKAGPELLQKPRSRSPSALESSPRRTRPATEAAPSGYPAMSPRTSDAQPGPETPKSRDISGAASLPSREGRPSSWMSADMTKKGKSEGISTSAQSASERLAPSMASAEQVMSASAAATAASAARAEPLFFM